MIWAVVLAAGESRRMGRPKMLLPYGEKTILESLVDTILLKPLPYPESQQLVEAFRIDERVTGLDPSISRVSGSFGLTRLMAAGFRLSTVCWWLL